jgi:lycopene cyclase domain-containing protein
MEYFLTLLGILIATIFLHKKLSIKIFPNKKALFLFYTICLVLGFIWDTLALLHKDWIFPPGKTIGIYMGIMPLEDLMFAVIIPYSLLVMYFLSIKIFKK